MKIELQVCTLEQAKRLKELGVKQESLFVHQSYSYNKIKLTDWDNRNNLLGFYSAFTVAELGEMLPPWQFAYKQSTGHYAAYKFHENEFVCQGVIPTTYETEAECKAAMLIHLLENSLITAEEVNRNL